jgi:hypothetical protein
MNAIQETLTLFPAASFSEIISMTPKYQTLTVKISRRLRSSWYVKYYADGARRTLVAPAVFESAPEQVKTALCDWALLPRRCRRDSCNANRRKELEHLIWSYFHQTGALKRRGVDPEKDAFTTQGVLYNLEEVRDYVNKKYLDNAVHTYVRWGGRATKTSYQMFRKDAKGNRYSIVTIAGAYDHPDIPRFAVEAIMYHEMLHVAIPPRKVNGRTMIHGPEFRKAERALPFYTQWREWEKRHMGRIISSLKRQKRKGST